MASPTGYRWETPVAGVPTRHSSTAWDLRWWIIAAVATSIAVHVALFVWMKRFHPSADPRVVELRTGVFETDLEQIAVPQEVLKSLATEPPDLTREVNADPPVKDLPSIEEIAEELKDKAVVLTPTITTPAANVEFSRPAPGTAGDLVDDLSNKRSSIDINLKDSLLSKATVMKPSAMKPDDDQLVIDANALSGAGNLKDNVIQSNKKGTGGNNGLDGFRNLDDLINYKGPIVGDFKAMLKTDLLFDFGSAQLRSDARLSLMKLGMIIQTNAKAQFRLVGHTDTIGDDLSNQKLSEARARAVKEWLVGSLKLDGRHIIVEGRGEREPLPGINPNGSPAEQQLNRRVEIHKSGG